jgi:hypothetical protein
MPLALLQRLAVRIVASIDRDFVELKYFCIWLARCGTPVIA